MKETEFDFIEHLKERINVDLKQRDTAHQQVSSTIMRQAAATGRLHSGNTIARLVESAITEQKTRSELLSNSLSETWLAFSPDRSVASPACQIIMDSAQRSSDDLIKNTTATPFAQTMGGTPTSLWNRLHDELKLVLDNLKLRLDRWRISLARSNDIAQIKQNTSITLSGNNNYIQAGIIDSNLSITLEAGPIRELKTALELSRDTLNHAEYYDAESRREGLELIDDCEREIIRYLPNKRRLSSGLQMLAAIIQTAGAATPAYQALKAAAAMIGLPLP